MSIYQQIFRKVYNQTSNRNSKDTWEHFVLGLKVYQWLCDNDPTYTNGLTTEEILEAIDEIFDIILTLLEMMKSPAELLGPVVYYANSFVQRAGIKHNQLFNLLLTSTIVTLKFWSETVPCSNKIMAEIFEFPVTDINLMERRFLSGIDYQLPLTQSQIQSFLSVVNVTATLKNSCKNFSNRFNLPNTSSTSSIVSTQSQTTSSSISCIIQQQQQQPVYIQNSSTTAQGC
ncbi:hypothetical protein DLAC_00136 [Tieghemostelium lacteum]|uniref:Uncharacterized protein n=1 Tax=Tieghemostelium lacteum TaxID=361077 RepID=A0A152A8X8_TIELA|nr:hypothetical protein DLAC_00136 [Tieghemostelium lacteum]|eukprot:KYR02678.1 hypothetical protein DLAC_00136 [Tieghemostelium lacteum]